MTTAPLTPADHDLIGAVLGSGMGLCVFVIFLRFADRRADRKQHKDHKQHKDRQ